MQTGYATFSIGLLQSRGGPYIFSQRILQPGLVESQIRYQPVQLAVLLLKQLQRRISETPIPA